MWTALVLAGALASGGHAGLVSTDPPAGSTVTLAPLFVRLDFGHDLLDAGAAVRVTGPGGAVVSSGGPRVYPTTVTQALAGELPAGDYTVSWRVTGADGRPLRGDFGFTTESAAQASAAPAALPTGPAPAAPVVTEGSRGSALPLALGVLVLFATVVVLLARRRASD